MSTFYCHNHHEKHESSDWRGKAVQTPKGFAVYYQCLTFKQSHYPEMIPQRIHEERVEYANDQLQSHRGGQLSREFLEAHPQRARKMLKDGAITKEDIKSSSYVWKSDVKGVTKKIDAEALL